MKTELLRHIEILKTDPKIKGLLQPAFWDWFFDKITKVPYFHLWWNKFNCPWMKENTEILKPELEDKFIHQPNVHEWILRIFFEEKGNKYTILDNWIWIFCSKKSRFILEYQLDNKKDYMNQSEEFFKKLNDWIVKEFNINI